MGQSGKGGVRKISVADEATDPFALTESSHRRETAALILCMVLPGYKFSYVFHGWTLPEAESDVFVWS